jgi:hypothetical protein
MEVTGEIRVSAALPPEKEALVTIGLEAGWVPVPVWTRWCREKFPALVGIRTPGHPARSPADILINRN